MGHAFQHTLMDALTRLHRMSGDNTFWQPGTDHAGIATQMVVERQLNAEGVHRRDIGREAFVERVWVWKAQSGDTISRQERRLGNSVDWSRDRFTMDEGSFARRHRSIRAIARGRTDLSRQASGELGPGAPHRALRPRSARRARSRHLWHLRYPLVDGSDHLVVATTRPETMLGDTAVAVHPDDERYRHLVGKQIRLPLTDRLDPDRRR